MPVQLGIDLLKARKATTSQHQRSCITFVGFVWEGCFRVWFAASYLADEIFRRILLAMFAAPITVNASALEAVTINLPFTCGVEPDRNP